MELYSFSVAAVKKCHKLGGLKQHKFHIGFYMLKMFLYVLYVKNPTWISGRKNQDVGQACVPLCRF